MAAVRICRYSKCRTRISKYNPGPRCWAHTPMANDRNHGNGIRGRPSNVTVYPVVENHMSDRFLTGIDDKLTDDDRALIATGEWIGVG
jgi:hypothetical protein